MFFDDLELFSSKSFVSPGSIGGKIRKYREMRGWTQKELGLRAGFSESTADVRIAQYEKNKRIPKEKVLKDIAAALEIDEMALFDADLLAKNRMYHALFDIEDFHGLHPVKIGEAYYLEFSGNTIFSSNGVSRYDSYAFLKKWYEKRQKYMLNNEDTKEERERKTAEYAIWRGGYPHNEAVVASSRLRDQMRMDKLQAEMDALNAKMKTEEELNRIDESLKDILPDVRSNSQPIKMESELILRIKNAIEGGLNIEIYSPEDSMEPNYNITHLLSIKTEEIMNDENKRRLYAGLVCAIEDIQKYGIEIRRQITSKKGVLFVTYSYLPSQYMYFQNLYDRWNDMIFIIDRKKRWSKFELSKYEERFVESITGKNDMLFSEGLE